MPNFTLEKRIKRKIRKFNVSGTELTLRITNPPGNPTYAEASQYLQDVIEELLEHIKREEEIEDTDMVRLSIVASTLESELWIPFMRAELMTAERVFVEVERVLQSKKDWLLESDMHVSLVHAKIPVGGVRLNPSNISIKLQQFLTRKRCIVNLKPDRFNLCCARSIVVSQAKIENYSRMRALKRNTSMQIKTAKILHQHANIEIGRLCGPEEWKMFQAVLPKDTSLVVISYEYFNGIIFHGNELARKKVVIYHAEKHYMPILSMTAFLSRSYICSLCMTGYSNKRQHKCKFMCPYCKSSEGPCIRVEYNTCRDCNLIFVSEDCRNNHLVAGDCGKRLRCPDCGKIYLAASKDKHKCYHTYCKHCRKIAPYQHRCYMPTLKKEKYERYKKYIFYDFESLLDSEKRHVPNLCVAHSVCNSCMSRPIDSSENCPCARYRVYFKGPDTVDKFCEWIFDGEKKGTVCIAHNSKAYDNHFIVDYLHRKCIKPEIIHNGRKLLYVGARGIRFIDSLCFMPMSLAKLPKAFGIQELAKGFFPHLGNTEENQEYVGPMFDESFYDPDGMSPEKRAEFKAWYSEHKNDVFDLQRDMLIYCKSDVSILQMACGIFRDMFVKHTGIEPFAKSVTLPSVCNTVFRTLFLKENQVGLIPSQGYYTGNQSSIALCWLESEAQTRGVKIKHAANSGEVCIEDMLVDGFDEENKTVLEFYGCEFHSCPDCKKDRSEINPLNGLTMHEQYVKTLLKEIKIKKAGYKLVTMWECVFKKQIKKDEKLLTLREKFRKFDKLEPRQSFYGGRTNATRLYYEADLEKGESISYRDVISLYPWVNKYCELPVGHPAVLTSGDDIGPHTKGIIKCTVLPPRNLFHPVLPVRIRSKLLFPLCRTCAENVTQGECTHDRETDRQFTGTWVSPELNRALERGYKVIEYHQAWAFEKTEMYDRVSKQGGLWSQYVDMWLALKQQSSGYPDWCQTETDKRKYLQTYEEKEGIALDRDSIEKNPGLRSLAKLMLCSAWGKLAQRNNLEKITYISEPEEYFKFMMSDKITVSDINFVNEEQVALKWAIKEECDQGLSHTNIVIAAYTTAYARLKLLDILESLDRRVLYFDTDSCIYISKQNQYEPETGDLLGDLKDECGGVSMTHFVSAGPKNYAYRLLTGEEVCKIRGFTLNYRNKLKLNYNTIAELIKNPENADEAKDLNTEEPYAIKREKNQIYTGPKTKKYRVVYDKRYIGDNLITYPFGWRP